MVILYAIRYGQLSGTDALAAACSRIGVRSACLAYQVASILWHCWQRMNSYQQRLSTPISS